MAIGYGQGINRALQSVKQALNHPLLESTPLEQAAGIIANFTGGEDLAFIEVADALTYLHRHTNESTEIIPGINCDPKMTDKVEVILVITGLGGKAVDRKAEKQEKMKRRPAREEYLSENYPQKPNTPVAELAGANSDLDLPAFLRRKSKNQ